MVRLSLTGKGHATDLAIVLGLSGFDPETIKIESIADIIEKVRLKNSLNFNNETEIPFYITEDIIFFT